MQPRSAVSLDVITVQNPCPASWDAMRGDARVRFCGECKLNVYNLSALTRTQAETLIARHEGRLCVRYFQREDGTVITQDCSAVRRALGRTRRMVVATASAMMCAILSPLGFGSSSPKGEDPAPPTSPTENALMMGKIAPQQREVRGEIAVMGDIAPPRQPLPPVKGVVAPATQPATQPAVQN